MTNPEPKQMTDFVQVTTTTGSRADAEKIAAELVARRLAGCVQIAGPVTSTYRWQGKIETAEEWMCVVKTSRVHLPVIQTVLKEIHPYDVPEIIATPVVDGSEAYLKWLSEQLQA
jgi:periplasmic divalent cation tolerance protein